jgi:hypothetical protein
MFGGLSWSRDSFSVANNLGDSVAWNLTRLEQTALLLARAQEWPIPPAGGYRKTIAPAIPAAIFIEGNLAHALLFQGHYDEALAIYRQYWDKPLHGKTLGEVTLEDFAAFDKAGLIHPDLSRMKQALSDLTSKSTNPR